MEIQRLAVVGSTRANSGSVDTNIDVVAADGVLSCATEGALEHFLVVSWCAIAAAIRHAGAVVVCYFQDEPYGRFRNFAQPCHSVFVNLVENGASWRWCCEPQVVVWVMRRA